MKDLGLLHYLLGLQITYFPDGLFISQGKYARDIINKARMSNCIISLTPCAPYTKLLKDEGPPFTDVKTYRSLVGYLQYLTFTRLDIAYSVNSVCQFMQSITEQYFLAVKQILHYIKGTLDYDITFRAARLELKAYTDSYQAGDPNDRRSMTGFVIFLGNCPISWSSRKQSLVSRSSTQAEYRAVVDTTSEVLWLQHLLDDLYITLPSAPMIHFDNVFAFALASNPIHNSKVKHMEVDVHFTREKVARGELSLQFVSSLQQLANIFTKGLDSLQFVPSLQQLTDILTKGLDSYKFRYLYCNLMLGSKHI